MTKTKQKGIYACGQCGSQHPRWSGQCTDCLQWNTIGYLEEAPRRSSASGYAGERSPLLHLKDVQKESITRFSAGMAELDRVLGGGLVPGEVILIGGDPGIGKSTLLLQTVCHLAPTTKCLYVSGEESLAQIAHRASRLEYGAVPLQLLAETEVTRILELLQAHTPNVVVIDSIQTLYHQDFPGAPGTVTQVRECTAQLTRFAKKNNTVIFLVGHVTKQGEVAGPRVLEHIVDAVIFFEGQSEGRFRMLRAMKNRFGAVNELGVFAMTEEGLKEVKNPSGIFLSRMSQPVPGSSVMVAWEGTRPLLLEIQALVDTSHGQPRRVAVGVDLNRLAMLLAVLHRHGHVFTADQDVFINLVGGLRIQETSVDLALLAALYSSVKNKALPRDLVIFGEVGLSGEIRPVPFGPERLKEAEKHGLKTALISKANQPKETLPGMSCHAVQTLAEAMDYLHGVLV